MNIKKHLPWLGALLPVASMQAETKPNVVVIYVDDMGIGDIGCYGGKFVPTPNIDKIAQDGLLFNQYYSSAPVSSPSRCGFNIGILSFFVSLYYLLCLLRRLDLLFICRNCSLRFLRTSRLCRII